MTNITIDRKFLEEVVELFDSAITARHPHEILRDIRAALAAPATAPDELERLRQIAHLTGTIFCYGNFVAETHNEAVLEKLLRENGTFWDSVEQYEKSQGWIP
jgi:hypothetical protein